MSNPAVAILTEPALCQLGGAEILVQALLQLQQLNNAGVSASQAFCDHPAAAMEFIEAYSKAYPALQLHTPDLPLPQHLYSMVVDGRLNPLPSVVAAETTKLEQADQIYPLYVLSLGAPEALMQALQHNNLANSSIRVLEVAPLEQASHDPMPIAEAVAAAPPAHSSWLTESSHATQRNDGDVSRSEPLADGSVGLSSVEVELDGIQIDQVSDPQTHDQSGRAHDEPAPTVIETNVAGLEARPSEIGLQTTAEVPASSIGISDPPSLSAVAATPTSEPVSDAAAAPATDLSSTSITQLDGPQVLDQSPAGDGIERPAEPASNDTDPSDPVDDPSEQDFATDGDDPTQAAPVPGQSEADVADTAAADPSASEGDDGGPPPGYSGVFNMPGEDVLYQPTATFSGNDDLNYALPTDDAGAPNFFAQVFGASLGAEVIDLEAMYRELPEPAAEDRASFNGLDLVLIRAPDPNPGDRNDHSAAYVEGEGPVSQDDPEPDDDAHNPLTAVHDADV
jgi:hypothetical protein